MKNLQEAIKSLEPRLDICVSCFKETPELKKEIYGVFYSFNNATLDMLDAFAAKVRDTTGASPALIKLSPCSTWFECLICGTINSKK